MVVNDESQTNGGYPNPGQWIPVQRNASEAHLILSVVICTHNPVFDNLSRVLAALKQQELDRSKWELLIVDNCSDTTQVKQLTVAWHPNYRYVYEHRKGIFHARQRAFYESQADLVVFFDDDTYPDPDYLLRTLSVAEQHPALGLWGGACSSPHEDLFPCWFTPSYFGIRHGFKQRIVHSKHTYYSVFGAGMTIRRAVFEGYCRHIEASEKHRLILHELPDGFLAGEDDDISLYSLYHHAPIGSFGELRIVHDLDPIRVNNAHLFELAKRITTSQLLRSWTWFGKPKRTRMYRIRFALFKCLACMKKRMSGNTASPKGCGHIGACIRDHIRWCLIHIKAEQAALKDIQRLNKQLRRKE
jgi:glycosyltransferase involved in cell wall biosynthesis